MVHVVLDAMGSDRAPEVEVSGALQAIDEDKEIFVTLVGDEKTLLAHLPKVPERLKIVHAEQRVTMHDKPAQALKTKRKSSISVGLNLLREGQGVGFVSAGNTGAVMGFALYQLGRIPGIKRPAIGALFPTLERFALVLDVGANAEVTAQNLLEFSLMGSIVMKHLEGIEKPRVGLLSIGEEETKGNKTVFHARELISEHREINFIGFVEGNDILFGKADVVVTDGFTGNVMLKFGEGVISFLTQIVKMEAKKNPLLLLAGLLARGSIKGVKKRLDFEEYGGAPLVGVNGIVIICHGRSSPRAIKNALLTAKRLHEQGLMEHLRKIELKAH